MAAGAARGACRRSPERALPRPGAGGAADPGAGATGQRCGCAGGPGGGGWQWPPRVARGGGRSGRRRGRLSRGSQLNGALWLRRAVVVAWIVAGTAVLLLVLSRLFAAAIPVPDSGRRRRGLAVRPGREQPLPLPAVLLPAAPQRAAGIPGLQQHSLITYRELTGLGIRCRTRRKCASSLADGLPEPRSWGPAAAPGRDSRPGPPAGPQTVHHAVVTPRPWAAAGSADRSTRCRDSCPGSPAGPRTVHQAST